MCSGEPLLGRPRRREPAIADQLVVEQERRADAGHAHRRPVRHAGDPPLLDAVVGPVRPSSRSKRNNPSRLARTTPAGGATGDGAERHARRRPRTSSHWSRSARPSGCRDPRRPDTPQPALTKRCSKLASPIARRRSALLGVVIGVVEDASGAARARHQRSGTDGPCRAPAPPSDRWPRTRAKPSPL